MLPSLQATGPSAPLGHQNKHYRHITYTLKPTHQFLYNHYRQNRHRITITTTSQSPPHHNHLHPYNSAYDQLSPTLKFPISIPVIQLDLPVPLNITYRQCHHDHRLRRRNHDDCHYHHHHHHHHHHHRTTTIDTITTTVTTTATTTTTTTSPTSTTTTITTTGSSQNRQLLCEPVVISDAMNAESWRWICCGED
uniref:Uncharacterized protein n=1 Tax=Octopus bimaculoides TaxID=37653 RepID=A0A0L8H7A8_OCTBM